MRLFPIRSLFLNRIASAAAAFALTTSIAAAQVNGVGAQPYLGWSSFSQQSISSGFLTQANIQAESDALAASGLQAHGFNYINMDSGMLGAYDSYARPIPNPTTFPDIQALVAHIHGNGQKAGLYWIPGVEYPAVAANDPIYGTPCHIQDILVKPYTRGNAFGTPNTTSPYHYKIDFTQPGAQAYINSVVAQFASWGFDYIKLDGVTPGSDVNSLAIDNRPDVEAYSQAIAASGRPMWLAISWDLDEDYLSTWQQYANSRRIDQDMECEGRCSTLTDWQRIYTRFREEIGWENAAGVTLGWNDLDDLDIGDGATDGLTNDEKQTAVTFWAMSAAPLYLGGDLRTLDAEGKSLLSNDEVLAVDQLGKPAQQMLGGRTPVWLIDAGDDTYYVGIFNLDEVAVDVTVPWSEIGLSGVGKVRDLWNQIDLGRHRTSFTTALNGHASRLLRVTAANYTQPGGGTSYEAEHAKLSGTAAAAPCAPCSGGEKVSGMSLGANNATTFNVNAPAAGTYLMQVDSMTGGNLRSFIYSVDNGMPQTLDSGGGSFLLPTPTTLPVTLQAGNNTIRLGPSQQGYAPDLDRILISSYPNAPLPAAATYEAELATLRGTVTANYCNYCSGLVETGNIGGSPADSVTFSNVTVPTTGMYQLEIDYATSGARSFYVTVNGGTPTELDLNGSSFAEPEATVIAVQLNAGVNTIAIGNPTGYAPQLDRIVVAPVVHSPDLVGQMTTQLDYGQNGILVFKLTNNGGSSAYGADVHRLSFTQTAGSASCMPHVEQTFPAQLGNIAPGEFRWFTALVDFGGCGSGAQFTATLIYSADRGADVGSVSVSNIAIGDQY